MSELLIPFLPLLIVFVGIGVILGLPVGKWAKALGTRWLLLAALFAVGPVLVPGVWEYARNNPPHSLAEVGTWLVVGAVAGSLLLRVCFGAGSGGRMIEHILFSAVYDVLKGFVGLIFKAIGKIFGVFSAFRRQPK